MVVHDGNGWVDCRCGLRHWGLHGAAGLLLLRIRPKQSPQLLLQLRAAWTHQGGSWAVPGGARDSHEDTVSAALREAHEETGLDPTLLSVVGEHLGIDHGDWSYRYVLAITRVELEVTMGSTESDELRWVPPAEVHRLPLLPAFGAAWPRLRTVLDTTMVTPD